MSRGRRLAGVTYVGPEEADAYRASGAWLWSTLGEEMRAAASEHPGKTFIGAEGTRLSFDEVDLRSESLAASLLETGLVPGERALFQVGTVPELVIALFGCLKAGIIPVCTLPQYRELEIGQLAQLSNARAYFVQADMSDSFDQLAFARRMMAAHPHVTHLVVLRGPAATGELAFDAMCRRFTRPQARGRVLPHEPHPEDVALFQLSGGSTGVPKIIPRMHAEYLGEAAAWNRRHALTQDDVCLWALPLIHNAGMVVMLVPSLLWRRTLILQARFEVTAFLAAIESYRITYTGSIGPIAPRIIELPNVEAFDLSSLRMLFTLARADDLEARTGVASQDIYGITEGLLMASEPDAPRAMRHGTVGRPTGIGERAKVVQVGGEAELHDGETGELCFKGPHSMRGYYNAPTETASAFTADGFFRSGDLVRAVTIDGTRCFVFEGRLKDNISRGGEKFAAAEVETLISRHPDVAEACVVAMPCPIYGERACAFVAARAGRPAPTTDELARFLQSSGLARYKCPERVEVLQSIPVTRVGKIDKAALRTMIADMLAAERRPDSTKVA